MHLSWYKQHSLSLETGKYPDYENNDIQPLLGQWTTQTELEFVIKLPQDTLM